ncbi:Uncharacterised protein [Streptococcus pneumoniae]|nr:Uncharacterised protein [Streptococcus pneumoniae]CJK09100.1 Uncharacterised protein [Streptococcus pneumoniae]COT90003.1 Uncharacterised protein [Streptococcus pneumoniae]
MNLTHLYVLLQFLLFLTHTKPNLQFLLSDPLKFHLNQIEMFYTCFIPPLNLLYK